MIPAMAVLFAARDFASQHLYQAAAMAVNVAVAVPAVLTHAKKGAFRKDVFLKVLPWMTAGIVLGVLLSDQFPGWVLQYFFATFLIYTGASTLTKLAMRRNKPQQDHSQEQETLTPMRCAIVGCAVGILAGILGIGGGALFIPLCLALCNTSFRHTVAISAALMCITALIGASLKMLTLSSHGDDAALALIIAATLTPSCVVGSFLGARLTHAIPVAKLKAVFGATLLVVAIKLVHTAEQSRTQPHNPVPNQHQQTPPTDAHK